MSYQSALISACNICPTCCSSTVLKKPPERVPLMLSWAHRLTFGGVWQIRSVVATVKTASGTSTTPAQYDPTRAYTTGDDVAFGPLTYSATDDVDAGVAPLPATALWDEAGSNPHLHVVLDGDNAPEAWVDKRSVSSTVIVAGGTHDTDYRVEMMATFRDCDMRTITLWDCVLVKVANCD